MNNPLRKPCMEDINSAVYRLMHRLDELRVINAEDPETDILCDKVTAVLEKHFNYPDYSNYN